MPARTWLPAKSGSTSGCWPRRRIGRCPLLRLCRGELPDVHWLPGPPVCHSVEREGAPVAR
eukprot:8470565-Alexandrium_andersonii.AAC.1